MNSIHVDRPQAEQRKIQTKNEFELCYLRHQYFRKVKYNPSEEEMKPYFKIASHLAKNTYFTYRQLFHLVGLESDDVVNIANVHMVSFLGLFALERMPEKLKEFEKTFVHIQDRAPTEKEIVYKNQANFTLFLKQRMQDVVRVCRQKAKNIKGLPAESYYFYHGQQKPPKFIYQLLNNHERFGYRKLDVAIYKSIKKKYGENELNFKVGDTYYIAVPLRNKGLSLYDLNGADLDPRESMHNMNPEDVYSYHEQSDLWEDRKEAFDGMPSKMKLKMMKSFIQKNSRNKRFREEITLAKTLVRRLERNGK